MENRITTDVLIIGAGPTGLMAANQLMRFGVDFIIIDSKEGPTRESRAILVTSRSLEIYQQMGLSEQVVAEGKVVDGFNLLRKGKVKGNIEIGEIGKGLSDFGYMLAFEQFKNERILSAQLDKAGKSVLWEHEYVKMLERKDRVVAQLNSKTGEVRIESQYIIGCEGARSPIRHELEFRFKGGTYEQKFFVADAQVDCDLSFNKLIISPGQKNFCALMPMDGDNNYRILGTLPRTVSKQKEVTFPEIEAVVKKTLSVRFDIQKINWFSVYKLHHRAVDHFSEGRVFLAGDSAHIHSPAGGQGMNTGLQDAYNLCWKLALVLNHEVPVKFLKTYNEERLPFAKWLLKFTDRGFTLMSSNNWLVKLVRKFIVLPLAGIMMRKKSLRPLAFKTVSQIGYSYLDSSISLDNSHQKLTFSAGDRFPYFVEDNLHLQMNCAGFNLLHIGAQPMPEEKKIVFSNCFPFPFEIIEDSKLDKWKSLGVKKEVYILVRPDNYIAFITDIIDEKQITDYLTMVGLRN